MCVREEWLLLLLLLLFLHRPILLRTHIEGYVIRVQKDQASNVSIYFQISIMKDACVSSGLYRKGDNTNKIC